MPALRPGWGLWQDWCQAQGLHSALVTGEQLSKLQSEVRLSDRHLIEVLATAREQGRLTLDAVQPVDPWRDAEAGFRPLDESLQDCLAAGWPHGYRGRRDAWLLALTRGLRMSRTQALAVRSSDLRSGWTFASHSLRHVDDPRVPTVHRRTLAGLPRDRGHVESVGRARTAHLGSCVSWCARARV